MARKDGPDVVVTLLGAERAGTSSMGNPTWDLLTDRGAFRTETNGSIGYSVDNYTNSKYGWVGKRVVLHTTRSGRVWGIDLFTGGEQS